MYLRWYISNLPIFIGTRLFEQGRTSLRKEQAHTIGRNHVCHWISRNLFYWRGCRLYMCEKTHGERCCRQTYKSRCRDEPAAKRKLCPEVKSISEYNCKLSINSRSFSFQNSTKFLMIYEAVIVWFMPNVQTGHRKTHISS